MALDEFAISRQQMARAQSDLRRVKGKLAVSKAVMQGATNTERPALAKNVKRLDTQIAVLTEQQKELNGDVERLQRETEKLAPTSVDVEMMEADITNWMCFWRGLARNGINSAWRRTRPRASRCCSERTCT
jgi:hypothetical protein